MHRWRPAGLGTTATATSASDGRLGRWICARQRSEIAYGRWFEVILGKSPSALDLTGSTPAAAATRALDDVLRNDFVCWYPGMSMAGGTQASQHREAA